ncbi:MAG: type I-E CRISPR-associated protein Cse2/CasB [Victivallaceae bacterium]
MSDNLAFKFVGTMISRIQSDTACRAALRRADNPNTASYAWGYLVPYCDILSERERLSFSTAAAALARECPTVNGTADIGEALYGCCDTKDDRDREQKRLRRLLACDTIPELAEVLRGTIKYIQSKSKVKLNYALLIVDMLHWDENKKMRWAKSFFGNTLDDEEVKNVSK